jgi:tRNA1Val (adenine37-N6)-methyltransferase
MISRPKSEEGVPMEHPLFLVPASLPLPFWPDETVEDLQNRGMRLLQRRDGFRFGTDSVLLSAYAAAFYPRSTRKPLVVADLGAGCGAVSLLLAARLDQARICGIEVDRRSCEILARNIALNRLEGRLAAMNIDIRQLACGCWPFADADTGPFSGQAHCSFDLVVANPPYLKPEQSFGFAAANEKPANAARMEMQLNLEQLLLAAERLLRPGGRLVMVHRAHRLTDVLSALRTRQLEPKTLRLVQPLPGRRPSVLLLSATKGGRPGGFQVEAPLIIASQPGHLSDETASWYGHEPLMTEKELYRDLLASHDMAAGAASKQ